MHNVCLSSNVFFFTFGKKVASTSFSLPWQRPLLYRNQSIDLLIRSIDWFLYVYMKVISVMKELAVVLNIFRICNLHDLFSQLVLTLPLPARVFLFEYFKHMLFAREELKINFCSIQIFIESQLSSLLTMNGYSSGGFYLILLPEQKLIKIQLIFAYSKSAMETLEQCLWSVQS